MIFKYLIVGGVSFIVDFSTFLFLVEIISFSWQSAQFFSFINGVSINFLLSRRLVFKKNYKRSRAIQASLTFLVSFIALILNYILIHFQHNFLEFDIYLAKFISIFFVFLFNYFLRKKIIFI
jgi:putative flippase GtrA